MDKMEGTACEYEPKEILLILLILSKCLIVFAAPFSYYLLRGKAAIHCERLSGDE